MHDIPPLQMSTTEKYMDQSFDFDQAKKTKLGEVNKFSTLNETNISKSSAIEMSEV